MRPNQTCSSLARLGALLATLAVAPALAAGRPAAAQPLLVPQWDHTRSAVGVNLDRVRSEATGIPFANLMKQARSWQRTGSGACATAYSAYVGGVDANGYPTSNSGVCNWTDFFSKVTSSQWPQGTYELHYSGSATINATGPVSSGGSGVANGGTFTVDGSPGPLKLEIDSGTPSNMRLYPPGGVCAANANPPYDVQAHSFCSTPRCPGGNCPDAVSCPAEFSECVEIADAAEAGELTFHPLWLARLGEYRAVRFMDWNAVNRSQPPTFAELTPPSYFSYNFFGRFDPNDVPPAVIAELCNLLSPIECWVNIPHTFPDGEAQKLFEFYRDNTNAGVIMLFELSNETWNGGFSQGREMAAEAWELDDATEFVGDLCCSGTRCTPPIEGTGDYSAMVSAGLQVGEYWLLTNSSGNCTSGSGSSEVYCLFNGTSYDPPDVGECAAEYHGHRTVNLSDIAEAVFSSEPVDRMRFVLARQATRQKTTTDTLDCTRRVAGNCYSDMDNVDYFAIAPYFGSDSDCAAPGATTEDLCASMEAGASGGFDPATGFFKASYDTITGAPYFKDWPMMTYETGQSQFEMDFQVCADVVALPNSCIADTYITALDHFKAQSASLPVRNFMQFNNTGRFWTDTSDLGLPLFGNNFGVRGSIYGAWPKESGMLEWINTPGNDCWWAACELPVPEPRFGSSLLLAAAMLFVLPGLSRAACERRVRCGVGAPRGSARRVESRRARS